MLKMYDVLSVCNVVLLKSYHVLFLEALFSYKDILSCQTAVLLCLKALLSCQCMVLISQIDILSCQLAVLTV